MRVVRYHQNATEKVLQTNLEVWIKDEATVIQEHKVDDNKYGQKDCHR